jgi:hypothetical protein
VPRLTPTSDLLAGFDPNSPLIPMPVRGSVWSQAPTGPLAKQIFALQDYHSFANLTQHALSQIGFLSGVPDWTSGAFKKFFELAPTVQNGEQLAKGVISGTTALVQQALQQTATSVPIVGIIVQLGLFLWEVIENALRTVDSDKQAPDQAIVYDLAGDLETANDLKSYSGQPDWTPLFLPPATEGWQLAEITWVPGGGERQGFKFYIPSHAVEAYGLVPGISERVGTYQFPEKAIGSSRPWDFYTGYGMSTTGELLPSSRKFSTLLWQTAMKSSVQMFQINSHATQDAWDAYYDSLWEYSGLDFSKKYNDEAARTIKWAIRRACTYTRIVATPNGPMITKESTIAAFPTATLEAGLTTPLTSRYNDITRYVSKVHRDRAKKALNTLVCAYVPPNAPLLRADSTLADLHEERRKQLLTHQARYDVELDLIPDQTYRNAMDEAQVLAVPQGATDVTMGGPFGPQRTAPPGAPQGLPQGVSPAARLSGKDPKTALVGLGVAAGVGYVAYKKQDQIKKFFMGLRGFRR